MRYTPDNEFRNGLLIEKYGRHANIMKRKEQLNGDCPRRNARKCTINVDPVVITL
jgi:hypothetical protein